MNASECQTLSCFLGALQERGASFSLDGESLKVGGPKGILSQDDMATIQANKPALVSLLRQKATNDQGTIQETTIPAPETATPTPPPAHVAPATTCTEMWETGSIPDESVSPLAGQHDPQGTPGMSGLPPLWVSGLMRICTMRPPPDIDLRRWRAIQQAAVTFERDGWATKAFELGWSAGEIFGVHAGAPIARVDAAGLLAMMAGADVELVELTQSVATFLVGRNRATQRLRRGEIFTREQRLLWENCQDG
ncbi:MAG: hypothetical protein H7839_20495 [Magnetococcus sp. YQC-5]